MRTDNLSLPVQCESERYNIANMTKKKLTTRSRLRPGLTAGNNAGRYA